MDLATYFERQRQKIDDALGEFLPAENAHPSQIHKAMRYSIFAGGKRLRPILAIAAFDACGGQGDVILPPACAIEMIHAYSLIHDDLPAMDDDDLRRGKPTSHKMFGEALAILAGDALLTHAFQLIARIVEYGPIYTQTLPTILMEFGHAAGTHGMIGGQVLDIEAEQKHLDLAGVQMVHELKTSKMIALPLTCGAILAEADKGVVSQMEEIGQKFGLAFQIVDDILDVQGSDENFGKPVGSDQEKGKSTYPSAVGIERSRMMAHELVEETKKLLIKIPGDTAILESIANFIIERAH